MNKLENDKIKREEFARLILEEELTIAEASRRVKLSGSYMSKVKQGIETPKHRAGRKRKRSLEEIQNSIDDYFDSFSDEYLTDKDGDYILGKNGQPVLKDPKQPTVTGLALACGYLSVESFNAAIMTGGKIAQCLLRAKSFVAEYYEQKLHQPGCQGAIFALEIQSGWRKPIEINQNTKADVKVENKMTDELLETVNGFLSKFGKPREEETNDTDEA